jgi:DNA-binding MarR family transcriptional regulator
MIEGCPATITNAVYIQSSASSGDLNNDLQEQQQQRLSTAYAWQKVQQLRDEVFGSDLFSDPAWDLLLDLHVNERRGKSLSVTDLYLSTSAPPTTTLRWIDLLTARGILARAVDPKHKRRFYVHFTEQGRSMMETALDLAMASDSDLGIARAQFSK